MRVFCLFDIQFIVHFFFFFGLQLAAIKLARYGEDLLFYLYYMNGGDLLQLLAAVELYAWLDTFHEQIRNDTSVTIKDEIIRPRTSTFVDVILYVMPTLQL